MVGSHEFSQDLKEQWSQGLCPIINGVVYPSGEVKWLNVEERSAQGKVSFKISPASPTSLRELSSEGCLEWTQYNTLQECSDPKAGIRAFAGEAGMGGDGFVAAFSLESGALLWLAFFDCSNPFVRLRIDSGLLLAETTRGNQWEFPLSAPEGVSVTDALSRL